MRAAGTWVARAGLFVPGLGVEVDDGDGLLDAARGQLDAGADWIKLYLDGPDADTSPFTAAELRAVVRMAHGRGKKVAAHATMLPGARAGAEAGPSWRFVSRWALEWCEARRRRSWSEAPAPRPGPGSDGDLPA